MPYFFVHFVAVVSVYICPSLCVRCPSFSADAVHLGHKSKGGLRYGHV
nr:MAG TPA: hypothetical protein [Caudoviricetes sp.]